MNLFSMHDEGYIKFNCNWEKTNNLYGYSLDEIDHCRNKLFELKLIGAYPDGIGYGNVSIRNKENTFLITGSATGNKSSLTEKDYALVTSYDFNKNSVSCIGAVKASSESLSHAIIYHSLENVNAVIHIHHLQLWTKMLQFYPTTDKHVTYGTPEMAFEIKRLLKLESTNKYQAFAMGGHREGIVVYGKSMEEALNITFSLYKNLL